LLYFRCLIRKKVIVTCCDAVCQDASRFWKSLESTVQLFGGSIHFGLIQCIGKCVLCNERKLKHWWLTCMLEDMMN
jgi:hypothetical protein